MPNKDHVWCKHLTCTTGDYVALDFDDHIIASPVYKLGTSMEKQEVEHNGNES